MFTTPHTKYRATRGSKRSLYAKVGRRRNERGRTLGAERLEDRHLLSAVISIADSSMYEMGNVSAFITAGSGGLSSPKDLTLGPDGNVYVTSGGTNSVLRYNALTGQLIGTFVTSNSGGLTNPIDLAFGPDGHLYVAGGNNAVFRYEGVTGAYLDTFVPAGSGGLSTPIGMCFGGDGNLYVSSRDTDAVLRYQGPTGTSPGAPLPAFDQSGATFVAPGSGGLDGPLDILFGPDGDLYVASTLTNSAVLRFEPTAGRYIATHIAPGVGGLGIPRGLAFDQEGRFYVTDAATNAVHRFNAQGEFLDDPISSASMSVRPAIGIVFDSQGRLLVSSRDTNEVLRYNGGVTVSLSEPSATTVSVSYATADGTATAGSDFTGQVGTVTFAAGQTTRHVVLVANDDTHQENSEVFSILLGNSVGAAIADGMSVVTIIDDESQRQIAVIDASATEGDDTAHYRGAFVQGIPWAHFNPLTFGPDGNLYTAVGTGPGYNTIRRYQGSTGEFIDTFMANDSPLHKIDGVRDMVFHTDGYLYVASSYTDEVLRYDALSGAFVDVFVEANSGGINHPDGIVFGPDVNADKVPELYVSCSESDNVARFDGATGQPIGTYVPSGSGGLTDAFALAFGPDGSALYVVSAGTNQILKYDAMTGAYLGVGASEGLVRPAKLIFGPDDLMYVTSHYNERIMRFTAGGTYVDDYVPPGSGGMIDPNWMVFGPDGDLYVTATGNSQVFRFGNEPEAVVTLTLSTASNLPVTAHYETSDGSATSGIDYLAANGTVTFTPGFTTSTILVPLLDDADLEGTEYFFANLIGTTGAFIADAQGIVAIRDNENVPLFTDSFELGQWNGLWVEDSQNDWYTSTQRKTDGSYCAEVDGSASDATLTIASPINLLPYGSAELAFDWLIESGLDTGEYLALDLFNGTSWQEVAKLRGNVDVENVWHSPVINIDGSYLVSNFQFRFRAKMDGSAEDANVDNVRLIATSLAGPPNQLPVAVDDAATTAEDTAAIINVLANDSDPDQDILQVESVTQGSHGAVVNHGNGTLTYTPSPNYFGTDGFSYTISDGRGGTATANVLVTVSSVNDAPVAADDQYSTLVNTLLNVPAATGVLANDTDVDNDPLTAVLATGPAHGLLVLNGDGSFNYTPDSGYVGSDGFTYLVRDGQAAEDTGTVLINVVESSPATLSINDVSKNEGKNGTTLFAFIVTRGGNTSGSVTVNYATANGSATAGVDYYATSGTLSFAAGETSKTINVGVKGDRVAESDETFYVNLTNAMNGEILRTQGLGTIVNDDGLALMAGFGEQFGGQTVTLGHVQQLMPWAVALWATGSHAAAPAQLTVELDDLPAGQLGAAFGHTITLDLDANGAGWHTGRTTPAAGRVDLLSVLSHEIGHLLGYDHSELADDLMCATLPLGTRRLPGNTPMIGHDLLRSAVASPLLLPEHRLERAFDELADASILASDMPSTTVVGSDLWMLPLTPLDYVAGERQYAEAGQARIFDTITDGVTELLDEELLDLLAASQR